MTCFTIQIINPGPMVHTPALLADLGLPHAALPEWVRQTRGLVVRVRPCHAEAAQAWETLADTTGLLTSRTHDQEGQVWHVGGPEQQIQAAAAQLEGSLQSASADLGRELGAAIRHATEPVPFATQIGSQTFQWGQRTYIMGIVNATPDSFSGDGLLADDANTPDGWVERAVQQALRFVSEGADLIDVGGESTRPGARSVDAENELRRVIPVIRAIRQQSDIPISIDTFKASVARAALDAGADLINDVWGLRMDPEIGTVAAERGVPLIIMHNRSRPRDVAQSEQLGGRYIGVRYQDLMLDILQELGDQVNNALAHGVPREQIIVDPGIGFGKTVQQNLQLLNQGDGLRVLGQPILLGPSRKSFIGYTLDLPPRERGNGTLACLALAIARNGADMVRVHDVASALQAARMADAIVHSTGLPDVRPRKA